MKGSISFAMLEKKIIHEMRNTINNAEDIIDLEKQFSKIVRQVISEVIEMQHIPVEILDDDVIFDPEVELYYRISKKLKGNAGFTELMDTSDLKNIIARFAASVHRKYLHLTRHREKARFKIR
mgnify:CR=1 FL=1